ncbi:MAG: hypothetical protein KDA69_12895 [Planctomycetaceae bacterium]|nr:hypothetical protein [Planctomycetaceae bacterium]MCA9045216.1 hypothetical protein [Planctomycetaceae bacterium]MCB9954182.1 hypothetical protein [Planctomycetaceae bacterium]
MIWSFRLIRTARGVAVHHVYLEENADAPTSCGETPFVAEAETVEDLRFLLKKIQDDALGNPVLDGTTFGLA